MGVIVTTFPRAVRVMEHTLMPLKDATTLAAQTPTRGLVVERRVHDVNWEVLVSTICPREYWGADEIDAAVMGRFKSCASSRS
jgi:hypothetical protein